MRTKRVRQLAPLEAGKRYEGYVGFVEGNPHVFAQTDYYAGVPRADVFPTRTAARRCYEDVRRVTIIIEEN